MAVTPYTIDSVVPGTMHGVHRLRNGITIDIPFTHPEVFDPEGLESNWADVDVFDVDTVAKFPVGTLLKINMKYYMYTEYGATIAAGDLLQSEGPDAVHDALPPTATAAGLSQFEVTSPESGSADFIKNEYAGGNVIAQINGTPGYEYEILAHDTLDISAAGTMTVRIMGNLAVALAATDDLAFLKHVAKEVIECPTTLTASSAGLVSRVLML